MSAPHKRILVNILVTIPVAVIVLGACALAAFSVQENRHFVQSVKQITDFTDSVQGAASQQTTFAQSAGDDLWVDLQHAGRSDAKDSHANAWGGDLRAITVATQTGAVAMRVEDDVPTRDCRRLALYFVDHASANMGVLAIEAQPVDDTKWTLVYPLAMPVYERAALFACGTNAYAHLAVTFKIR